jgi:DNA-binding transcriptional LysR family regulator
MDNISLRQLQTLVAVADTGSFRRAAEQLHRSQSAVSVQIQQLEEVLGVGLFHRTTRRVALTAEGERLLGRTRRALAEIQAGVRELRDEVELQRGRVVIGAPPTISSTRLPRLIAAFRDRHPGITIQVNEDFAANIIERLRNQELDFALTPQLGDSQDIDALAIASDDYVAVLHHGFAVPEDGVIEFASLLGEPMLVLPRATALRRELDQVFEGLGRVLRPTFEVMHHLTLLAMVDAGLGVTVLPAIALEAAGFANLKTARLSKPTLGREICLLTLKGQVLSPAAAACARMIQNNFSTDPATCYS